MKIKYEIDSENLQEVLNHLTATRLRLVKLASISTNDANLDCEIFTLDGIIRQLNNDKLSKPKMLGEPVLHERWVEVENDAYADIHQKAQGLTPTSTNASLHVYEEQYLIDGCYYRFLWAIDVEDKENTFPNIDRQEFYNLLITND